MQWKRHINFNKNSLPKKLRLIEFLYRKQTSQRGYYPKIQHAYAIPDRFSLTVLQYQKTANKYCRKIGRKNFKMSLVSIRWKARKRHALDYSRSVQLYTFSILREKSRGFLARPVYLAVGPIGKRDWFR